MPGRLRPRLFGEKDRTAMRWTPADVEAYQARQVSPNGDVSRQPVPTKALVSKRARYTAKREKFDGVCFGSQAELRRYKELKLMQDAKVISGLGIHPRYDLYVGTEKIGFIELDFEYFDIAQQRLIHEDVKDPKKNSSTRTAIYKWKRKHLWLQQGIEIVEVTA